MRGDQCDLRKQWLVTKASSDSMRICWVGMLVAIAVAYSEYAGLRKLILGAMSHPVYAPVPEWLVDYQPCYSLHTIAVGLSLFASRRVGLFCVICLELDYGRKWTALNVCALCFDLREELGLGLWLRRLLERGLMWHESLGW